jgi:hypothetical protein
VLFPEDVLVNLPVLATVKRERIADERFCLLPHLVGLLCEQLAFWTVIALWFFFASVDRSGRETSQACAAVTTLLAHFRTASRNSALHR